jgi:hypothetical protein
MDADDFDDDELLLLKLEEEEHIVIVTRGLRVSAWAVIPYMLLTIELLGESTLN